MIILLTKAAALASNTGMVDTKGSEQMIYKGDIVRIRAEFLDKAERVIPYTAIEDEEGGRVLIEAQLGWPINPTERVEVFMLERIGYR
jgi:hypothetical protein